MGGIYEVLESTEDEVDGQNWGLWLESYITKLVDASSRIPLLVNHIYFGDLD